MNGPGSSRSVSIERQRVISTSSWAHVPTASLPASVTMRAPDSRTAAISAWLTAMFESRVMMSHPLAAVCGIHTVSGVCGRVIGQAGRCRRCKNPPGSPG
jgi:hypothetical protein